MLSRNKSSGKSSVSNRGAGGMGSRSKQLQSQTSKRGQQPQPYQQQQNQMINSQQNSQVNALNLSKDQSRQLNNLDFHYEAITNLIHEFLLKNGMQKTLNIFQDEIFDPDILNTSENYEEQLLNAFSKGQRDLFFSKWIKYIPVNIRFKDDRANKLEFYLQVYFLIYKIHPLYRKQQYLDKDSIAFFKEYLDSRGSELSKTNEFLHYYALPYINKPQEHQALAHLFTNEWIMEIKQRLIDFLQNLYPHEQVPLLYHIYQQYIANNLMSGQPNFNQLMSDISPILSHNGNNLNIHEQSISRDASQYMGYINQLEQNNKELLSVIQEFNPKYNNLQKNYKDFAEQAKSLLFESQSKWFSIAKELFLASKDILNLFDQSRKGMNVQQTQIGQLDSKIGKFDQLFNQSIEDILSQIDVSIFERPFQIEEIHLENIKPMKNNNQINQNQELIMNPIVYENPYQPVDFNKISQFFMKNDNITQICAILQALRWRITKTKGAFVRREIVIQYSSNDIIGCKPQTEPLMKALLQKDQKIKEFALRLINAMASDFHGRSYLVESENLVKVLIQILIEEQQDSIIRKNALGSLQKLSLRRKPQIIMIKNNLIKWIVKTLREEKDNLTEYSYEYATALFMNLSLRSQGKLKCQDPNDDVLNVLNDLLEHENMQVRTFVNGTLYSLLSRQILREKAKEMGMAEILTYLMENSDERFKKQIQYIMDQLNREQPDEEDVQSDSNEEDNDVDDIDDEEDIGDEDENEEMIENNQGMLLGEELLNNQFSLKGEEAQKQKHQIEQIMLQSQIQRNQMIQRADNSIDNSIPFNRPTTPLLSNSLMNSYSTSHNNIHQNVDNENRSQMPSELKSRPKILRTPLQQNRSDMKNKEFTYATNENLQENMKNSIIKQQQSYVEQQSPMLPQQKNQQNVLSNSLVQNKNNQGEIFIQNSSQQIQEQEVDIPNELKAKLPKEEVQEFKVAFSSKPKIPRTPPDGIRRNYQ